MAITQTHADPDNRFGAPTLDANATKLLSMLDTAFRRLSQQQGAMPMTMPALLPVADMARLDLFVNFPHLVLLPSALKEEETSRYSSAAQLRSVPGEDLQASDLVLPTAACFGVYLHLQKRVLAKAVKITVLGRCFRRESFYHGLRRMMGFHMREAVCVGSSDQTREHVDEMGAHIEKFAAGLRLPLRREKASDPFFDPTGSRALMQKLAPVKHEFLHGDLAIASVNLHRNFFGERCEITIAGQEGSAFSSCAAFGLERWIAVLVEHFHGDWPTIFAAVGEVGGLKKDGE